MADIKLKKRSGLGKGLNAILSDSDAVQHKDEVAEVQEIINRISEIDIGSIETNPYQPRTDFDAEALAELADSIKVQGIIQPITVRQLEKGVYQLIAGERRLQASKIAGLSAIPAYIRLANDQEMLEMALIENTHRQDLNAVEIALSYQRLISECNLKQEELGDRVGKNRATVSNYLRLLRLPPAIQASLRDRKLTVGHARALINLENIDQQLYIFERTLKEELSVRKVEELVRQVMAEGSFEQNKPTKTPNESPDYALVQLQSRLSSRFGTKIQIKRGKDQKGEIKIPFLSDEDLNRLLEILEGE